MTTIGNSATATKAAGPSAGRRPGRGEKPLLLAMADSLQAIAAILAPMKRDMDAARGHISDVMLDRLRLDQGRLAGMADGVRAAAALPDHTGRVLRRSPPQRHDDTKGRCRWGWWPSSTRAAPTLPPTRRRWPSRAATSACSAAARRPTAPPAPSWQALKDGITAAGGDPDIVNIVEDTSHQSAKDIMTARVWWIC